SYYILACLWLGLSNPGWAQEETLPPPPAQNVIGAAGQPAAPPPPASTGPSSSAALTSQTLQVISAAANLAQEVVQTREAQNPPPAAPNAPQANAGPPQDPPGAPAQDNATAAGGFQRGASSLLAQARLLEQQNQARGQAAALDTAHTGIFALDLGWGMQYLHRHQKGEYGKFHQARLGADYLFLAAKFKKGHWWWAAQGQTFTFKNSGDLEVSHDLCAYQLRMGYQHLFMGVDFTQQYLLLLPPVNKSVLETSIIPQLGLWGEVVLPTAIATKLAGWLSLGIPVASHSSSEDYRLHRQKGLRLSVALRWQRSLYPSQRFPVDYFWANRISWQKTRREVRGDGGKGHLALDELGVVSIIGVQARF
ncbi:MAG: hypothetical protein J6Y94_06540, partial [Bacteriovoracaceae bacterium]|nr:hypothetical protein [Bacteriovoracaceae bacterium]